jgi:hypothetical protein
MEVVGHSFPHLKHLGLNSWWFEIELEEFFFDNNQALGIARSMPEINDI